MKKIPRQTLRKVWENVSPNSNNNKVKILNHLHVPPYRTDYDELVVDEFQIRRNLNKRGPNGELE